MFEKTSELLISNLFQLSRFKRNESGNLNVDDIKSTDNVLVVDLADYCANTPLDARPVDEFGCPVDVDKDGVPDYRDEQLDTPDTAFAKENGIAYSNEDYQLMYDRYYDSTGLFSDWNEERREWGSDPRDYEAYKKSIREKDTSTQQLFIVLGSDKIRTSANDLYKELSNKNFKVIESGDSVLYVIGGFETVDDMTDEIANLENDSIEVQGSSLGGSLRRFHRWFQGEAQ